MDNILNTGNLIALNIIFFFYYDYDICEDVVYVVLEIGILPAAKYTIGLIWSESFLNKLISLPINYYQKRYLGDVVSRLQSLNEIQEAFTARMIGATLDAIITIFLLLAMGFYSITLCMMIVLLH
ncbi:ABC transporter transmembrane domain-containing protein [Providencia hangzhouensis]